MNNKEIETDLIEHFKEVMTIFKKRGGNNACTDYPSMHEFLLKKYNIDLFDGKNNDGSILYRKLTHEIIPLLERKDILKRYKLFDGTWLFIINKRLKMFR